MLQTAVGLTRSRVNPLILVAAVGVGLAVSADGHLAVGIGIAAGGALAYINGLLLSRRVDLAASVGNMAAALLIMQAGLLISLTCMAIATIILAHYSVATALGEAAGFGCAHLAILGSYYWMHARVEPGPAGYARARETEA